MARTQAELLVRAARRDTSSVGAIFRWQRGFYLAMTIGIIPYAMLFMSYVALELFHWWRGESGETSFSRGFDVVMLLFLPLIVAIIVSGSTYSRKLGTSLWALRRAATVGDDELLPPIASQPAPLEPDEMSSMPQYFAHIRWLDDLVSARLVTGSRIAIAGYLPIAILQLWAVTPSRSPTGLLHFSPYSIPAMLAAMIYFFVVMVGVLSIVVITSAWHGRGVTVTADADGLSWRRRRFSSRQQRVAWGGLRSFTQIDFLTTPSYTAQTKSKMFVLDTGDAILAWGYEPMHSVYGESRTAELTSLIELIVTHTNLPLRDATPLATEIAEKAGGVNGRYWRRMLAPQGGARPAATIAGIDDVLRPPRAERLRAWAPVWLAFTPLVAYLVVVIVFMATRP